MSPTYEPVTDPARLLASFGVTWPDAHAAPPWAQAGMVAPFIVRAGAAPALARLGLHGLLPHFASDIGMSRQSGHCRVETMKSQPTFRESWWAGRRCVVPVQCIAEWRYESGRPELCHIQQADDEPLRLAGLWNDWPGPGGDTVPTFTLLTVNADGHEVFGRMNAPDHEKRMPAILPASLQDLWLLGSLKDAERLLARYPAPQLQVTSTAPLFKAPPEPSSWAVSVDMFATEWHVLAAEPPRRRPARPPRALPPPAPERPAPTTGDLF